MGPRCGPIRAQPYARIGRTTNPCEQTTRVQGCYGEPLVVINKTVIHFMNPINQEKSMKKMSTKSALRDFSEYSLLGGRKLRPDSR